MKNRTLNSSSTLFATTKIVVRKCLLIVLLLAFPMMLYAQSDTQQNRSQSVQASSSVIDVYTPSNKRFVARVAASASSNTVSQDGVWKIVRFAKPMVPVWVSADYVRTAGQDVEIVASRLNGRIQPSLGAPIVNTFQAGYRSKVLAQRNGFVQIYAPESWLFALNRANTENSSERNKAGWKLDRESGTVQTPSTTGSAGSISAADKPVESAITTEILPEDIPQADQVETAVAQDSASSEAVDSGRKAPVDSANVADKNTQKPARLHRIAPGDTISLLVFGESDLSASALRVPQSGVVSFPLIGSTQVAGKTVAEVEEGVRRILASGYVNNPKLSVTIDRYRDIFIRGAVQQTGSFPFVEGLTVATALAVAGGTKNSAKANGVSIMRDGAMVQVGLSVDSRYEIASGDIITIDEELGVSDEATSYVYLHGEVKKPGEYEFRRGLTVEKAVVLAGGFTLRASRKKISVSRTVDGQEEPEKLRKVKLYLPVQPGDIINVGASWF